MSCKIEDMHARNVLPVIVGGTTYWIQHLLFPNRLVADPSRQMNKQSVGCSPIVEGALASLSGEQRQLFDVLPVGNSGAEAGPSDDYSLRLYTLLSSIDPDMAARWHWRDTRKVLRNLQIIKETGQRASEIVREQDKRRNEARYWLSYSCRRYLSTACFSRYPTLLLWPFTPPEILNQRLDVRVDHMVNVSDVPVLELVAS